MPNTTMTPDHDESKPRGRWPTYLAVGMVLLLVIYPLSIGPATVLFFRINNQTFRQGVNAFYSPLEVAANSTGTHDFLMGYCNWWIRVTNS
jgi:hypothetical protein